MQYFIMSEERREGPFTEEELRDRIQSGEVHAQTPVWHKGLEKWKPCGNLFGDMPEMDSWYIMNGERREGPMTPKVFQNEVTAGRVTANTIVWRTGMPRWRRLGRVAFDQGVDLPMVRTPEAVAAPRPSTLTPSPSFSHYSVPTPPPSAGTMTPHPGPRGAAPPAPPTAGTHEEPIHVPGMVLPPAIPTTAHAEGVELGLNPLYSFDLDEPRPAARPAPKPARGGGMARFDGISPPFDYGGFWIRFLAILIDTILMGAVAAVVMAALGISFAQYAGAGGALTPEDAQAMATAAMRRVMLVWLLTALYPILTTWWLGGTLGKLVCGLRVVRSDGEALSLLRCASRELLKMFVSGQIFMIGYLLAAFTEEKKALHDMICDSRVVKNG